MLDGGETVRYARPVGRGKATVLDDHPRLNLEIVVDG
jgi:hypothetical protein